MGGGLAWDGARLAHSVLLGDVSSDFVLLRLLAIEVLTAFDEAARLLTVVDEIRRQFLLACFLGQVEAVRVLLRHNRLLLGLQKTGHTILVQRPSLNHIRPVMYG